MMSSDFTNYTACPAIYAGNYYLPKAGEIRSITFGEIASLSSMKKLSSMFDMGYLSYTQ